MTNTTAAPAPARPDSHLLAVPGTADYATAAGRFTAERHYGDDGMDGWEIRDTEADTDELFGCPAFVPGDVNAARRAVAQVVDAEHRDAVIAWTRELAAADPAIAAQVADMRYTAAVYGRAMGTVGNYQTEQIGRAPGAEFITVYVAREEYPAAIAAGPTR